MQPEARLFAVEELTFVARDGKRGRDFPCEVWRPEGEGAHPLVIFSHASGHHRRGSSFLCSHLASRGYIVAALDHSEVVAPELRRVEGESNEERRARIGDIIASRVPDVRFLIGHLLSRPERMRIAPGSIGLVGHSFGGWTALATVDEEPRIGAVVALAPAGASVRKAAILPATLAFDWDRDVPTLFIVAAHDNSLPMEGMREIYGRTPSTKRMVILPDADHAHFMDDAEKMHESFRTMEPTPELSEIQEGMKPFAELLPEAAAHAIIQEETVAHFDAVLKR